MTIQSEHKSIAEIDHLESVVSSSLAWGAWLDTLLQGGTSNSSVAASHVRGHVLRGKEQEQNGQEKR
jgi:hypothetical protein